MGYLSLLRLRQLSDQHALCHVVRNISLLLDYVSESVQIGTHLLTLPCVRNVGCPRTLFACVLVSKTRWTLSMTLSMPFLRPALSLFLPALINISLCAQRFLAEEPLLAVQWRNWLTTKVQRGKRRTANGLSVHQERLSCSESTPLYMVL